MKSLHKNILLISGFIVLMVSPGWAQRQTASQNTSRQQAQTFRPAVEPVASPALNNTSSSTERERIQYKTLLQRRNALKRYLSTIRPDSKDYQAALNSIRELEVQIGGLEKELSQASRPGVVSNRLPRPRNSSLALSHSEAPSSNTQRSVSVASISVSSSLQGEEVPDDDDRKESEAPPEDYVTWLNRLVDEKTVALVNQGSNANQTETPAQSENSTSLVDQSSASDLVGVGLNLAGLSTNTEDMKDANSVSVTTTAYAIYAALKGADPLDPVFYNKHNKWRRLSFTLGYDDEMKEVDGEEIKDRATIAGFKYLIKNGRDASEKENEEESAQIRDRLRAAADEFGQLDEQVQAYLFRKTKNTLVRNTYQTFLAEEIRGQEERIRGLNERITDPRTPDEINAEIQQLQLQINAGQNEGANRARIVALESQLRFKDQAKARGEVIEKYRATAAIDFEKLFDETKKRSEWTEGEQEYYNVGFIRNVLRKDFQLVLRDLTPAERLQLEQFVDARLNPFVELGTTVRKALENIRNQPQFSFSVLTKTRKDGDDEYTADLIYERGMTTRTFLTLNGGFKYKDSPLIGGDTRGGSASGQLQFQVTSEDSLITKSPIYLYLSTENEWMAGKKPALKAQAKVKIPITDGIDVPISLTFANRTDLIDESDVRGQFGFTIDTSKLLRAFKFKLPGADKLNPAFNPVQ